MPVFILYFDRKIRLSPKIISTIPEDTTTKSLKAGSAGNQRGTCAWNSCLRIVRCPMPADAMNKPSAMREIFWSGDVFIMKGFSMQCTISKRKRMRLARQTKLISNQFQSKYFFILELLFICLHYYFYSIIIKESK